MRNVLVTGAAGFIGSHSSIALLSRFDRVVGLDNLNTYYSPEIKRSNLTTVAQSTSPGNEFVFVEGDLRDPALVRQLFDEHEFDAVVHLGAMAGVRVSIEQPELYYDVNVIGTLNLLGIAREFGLNNFVFASTSSVYGRSETSPFAETQACDRPLSPYAGSKRAAELLCHAYHHLHGLNITVLRFFTVYGPRGRPDMMAYKVLSNIFNGDPVPIYNAGEMYRDWTFISDIVSGVAAAAEHPLGFEIINLGRGEPVKLTEFVRCIETASGRTANLTPEPMPDADVPYTFADITKARTLLGYNPSVSVEEGVNRLWEWYRTEMLAHA